MPCILRLTYWIFLIRLKEGIQIKSSERISITSEEGTSVYKLNIKETLADDEGLYSFVAINKEGETRGDIKVSVHCTLIKLNQKVISWF